MKTTAELIFSMPWEDHSLHYAVISEISKGSFVATYLNIKPTFNPTLGFWTTPYVAPRSKSIKAEMTSDCDVTIVTYEQWLEAQKPAPQRPRVGETWMTSNGPIKIVHIKHGDVISWRCCGEHESGGLCIYGLEELKSLPPEVMFTKAILSKLEEEPVDTQSLLIDVAQLILAGKLDAELAALGYTKIKQQ